MLERLAPHDIAAEEAVLACCLVDDDALAMVRPLLEPGDFFRGSHADIYAAMLALAGRGEPTNTVTVAHELAVRGQLAGVGGPAALSQLTTDLPTAVGVEHYARLVANDATHRELIRLAGKLANGAYQGGPQAQRLVDAFETQLDALRRGGSGPTVAAVGADELQATEFPEPRFAVEGLIPEGLSILAGAPKLGKTWLMLNVAIAVATGGRALGRFVASEGVVLYLALEDGRRRIKRRIRQLLGDGRWPRALRIGDSLRRLDDGGVEQLDDWLAGEPAARLVVVDTLARVRGRGRKEASAYAQDYDAIAPLQGLAQRRGVAIVLTHHTRKAGSDDPFDLISGTLGLTGAADGAFVLRRARGAEDAVLSVTGRDIDEAEYALRWDGSVGTWTVAGDGAAARRSPERQEIIAVLRGTKDGLTPGELAEIDPRERSRNALKVLLWKMAQDGDLAHGRGGRYIVADSSQLTPSEQKPLTALPVNPVNPLTGVPLATGPPVNAVNGYSVNAVNANGRALPCHWCQAPADGVSARGRPVCAACRPREES